MMEIETILNDRQLAQNAFEWVELALERRQAASGEGPLFLPPLAPGIIVTGLEVCDDYACRCGWTITIRGRDPLRRARLAALAARPPDDRFGAFRILAVRDGDTFWTVRIAGTGDLGLDAVVQVLLAPTSL
ncbi:MAG: hypothetical protein RMM58_10080 [Chloroflexota bacterium]|nr:hypothetical protein [Dehalococcoidia bacterium]MDW8254214.1 hypothetical protein [Chloroflexota bacterium]